MIPEFPHFKRIELADRAQLETLLPYTPYSDFVFTNLWCWNINNKRKISLLYGNLVVLMTDYITNRPHLSFYGHRKPVRTARTLLQYAQEHDIELCLKYVPHTTARHIRSSSLVTHADEENFDYIFSTQQIASSAGGDLKRKRKYANQFARLYQNAHFKTHPITDARVQRHLRSTFATWNLQKHPGDTTALRYEEMAFKRLLKTASEHDVIASCVYDGDTMIGFSLDELLGKGYAISHFLKADTHYTGVYEYLNQNTAKFLMQKGIQYWNWEQDLNIEGLRKLKLSYRPINYLKKYKIYI